MKGSLWIVEGRKISGKKTTVQTENLAKDDICGEENTYSFGPKLFRLPLEVWGCPDYYPPIINQAKSTGEYLVEVFSC